MGSRCSSPAPALAGGGTMSPSFGCVIGVRKGRSLPLPVGPAETGCSPRAGAPYAGSELGARADGELSSRARAGLESNGDGTPLSNGGGVPLSNGDGAAVSDPRGTPVPNVGAVPKAGGA